MRNVAFKPESIEQFGPTTIFYTLKNVYNLTSARKRSIVGNDAIG